MLSICFATIVLAAAQPSEDYFTAARAAYVRPEYAACTNTVITRWTTSTLDRADHPVPGGSIGWVAVEGMRNVRDIGGWNGLRTGRAYRGTEPDGHRKDGVLLHGLEITSNGLETIRSVMRIKTDLDLRGAGECPHPDVSSLGVALVRAPVRAYDGLDATKGEWAAALRLFADARHYPIYFHCWGGADRTGQLAFLLEGLCGVSECDLCIDYELTTFGGYPRLRSRGFVDLLNRIKSRPGTALKDRFADFVERELGLTKREIAAIRRNLTGEKLMATGCPSGARGGVPTGCDASVMSEAYWKIWNEAEQAKIDVDIEANRKTEGSFRIPAPAGTDVRYEQIDHDFRFGAHIFNFNQLGKTEWNDAYKASYGQGGIFNQATVAFYWTNYEPTPGHLRANGAWEDTEAYWNALTPEQAMFDVNWRRPAPGPVIDFLKTKDVAIHGHILIWGSAKPYWIYDWYCPEREKRAFDALGIPRHSTFMKRAKAGAEGNFGFAREWKAAWSRNYNKASEAELERMAPVFTANMRRLFRKRVFDVAGAFGDVADSWDVVNESAQDWAKYRKSRTGHKVWKSVYGLMPGDYPLHALMDAKEAISPTANLAINDYHISPDFLEQVKQLEAEGAKIDIVGCQMHIFNTNDCMRLAHGATDVNWVGTPQIIQDRLDMMAKTGKPLHVSEITITSPGADSRSRQIQAILTRNIYRKWFSHRALMGITWWNTVDGGGVYGEPLVSGLFTRDMKKKPAYEALDELINHEWKTTGTAKVVGEGGSVSFRGFRGRYRLSWTCPACGNTHSRVVELSGDGVVETTAQPRPEGCFRYVRNFTVDGRSVRVDAPATALDLAKIYPKDVIRGKDGERWADVACTLVAPKDGTYDVLYQNDWFGRLLVNGQRVGGDLSGPYNGLRRLAVPLKKGKNQFVFQTRSGSVGEWTFTLALPVETPVWGNGVFKAIPCQGDAGTPIKTEVLVEFAKSDEHPRNSEGDVIRLRDGRLLVVYSHFYKDASSKFADGGSDDSSAELVLTESADGGKTWSKMRTAVRKDKGALNVMSASFLRLDDGRLALFYLNKVSSADCRPVMVVSSDEGKTWSAPVACVGGREKGYYVLNNARAVRLKSGRIALPLALHPFDGKRHAEGAFLLCALSDDDGRTWRLSSDRRRGTPPPGAKKLSLQEPGLVELRDGRLMMYARSNERRQWRLFSTDGGEHWTEPEPVTEYATTTFSPVTYARLADGRLVVVFNDGAAHTDAAPAGLERRWPLAVGVSSDEGKTWMTKVLEPDDAKGTVHACYTAVREIAGRLVLVYCHRDMLATTRVVSVPLDWLP